jgi:hypothetical protein
VAYTGLLVLGGAEKLSWDSETRHPARAAWNAVASVPVNEDGTINLRLFFHPDAGLTVVARKRFLPGRCTWPAGHRRTLPAAQSLPERRRGMTRSDHHLRGTYWGT